MVGLGLARSLPSAHLDATAAVHLCHPRHAMVPCDRDVQGLSQEVSVEQ